MRLTTTKKKRGRIKSKEQISTRVDEAVMERIREYADRTGMQPTAFYEQALALHIERVEGLPVDTQSLNVLVSRMDVNEGRAVRRALGLYVLAEMRELDPREDLLLDIVEGIFENAEHWPGYADALTSVRKRRAKTEWAT